jgi:pyridoxine 5-phosphate synthase
MPELGVNIDHIASVRQIRGNRDLSLQQAAEICEAAGANSIVVHLREDRRHINDLDVSLLRKTIKTRLNLEMSLAGSIVDFACKIRPDQVTIVPEKRKEVTTEGGLDVIANFKKLERACKKLSGCGISISLFIDPEKSQIEAARKLGIRKVELHTGRYAGAGNKFLRDKFLKQIKTAAELARKNGMRVFAGHGLDYSNVKPIAGIKDIEELNIGYSIICRAALFGLGQAIKEMRSLLRNKRG